METLPQADNQYMTVMVETTLEPEPTLEEMMEYWRHILTISKCEGCSRHMTCWSSNSVYYFPKAIFKVCSKKEVREAFRRLQEMKEGKPLGYFAIRGKWFKVIQNLLRG